jgi:hypothetical protein
MHPSDVVRLDLARAKRAQAKMMAVNIASTTLDLEPRHTGPYLFRVVGGSLVVVWGVLGFLLWALVLGTRYLLG